LRSRLCIQAGADSTANINWTFTTNAFWGENPAGTWTLNVRDTFLSDTGTWNSYSASLRQGTIVLNTRTVSGNVDLSPFDGPKNLETVAVKLFDPGTANEVSSFPAVALDASGNYSLSTTLNGTYDMTMKGRHWLRKRELNVVVTSNVVRNFVLINGDIDDDNQVTVFDYGVLSDYFDKTSADSDWATVGGNGFAPKDADVDGDDQVTVFDYGIISDSFDKTGDD